MTNLDFTELLNLARLAGWGAADILMQFQQSSFEVDDSGDGPVTSADLAANDFILNTLQTRLGTEDFGYLTEETYKAQPSRDRLSKSVVWIIDPLDGTKEFIQKTAEFAVHIALVCEHRPVLAVVVRPAVGKLYAATLNGGTTIEQRHIPAHPIRVSRRNQLDEMSLVMTRSHRNDHFLQLVQRFPVQQQRSVGSLGGKIAAIVEQEADVYLALSGTSAAKDWDLAAPELILTEAGGSFTHFDDTPLLYNQEDVTQWGGILASNGTCHAALCTAATQILQEIDGTTM